MLQVLEEGKKPVKLVVYSFRGSRCTKKTGHCAGVDHFNRKYVYAPLVGRDRALQL